jgi:hypothetical protein
MRPPHPSTPESRVGPLFTPLGEVSSTAVCIRQAAGRATLPLLKRTRRRTASHLLARDRQKPDGHAEGLGLAGGPLPAPARCFGITDFQQWIDLCG